MRLVWTFPDDVATAVDVDETGANTTDVPVSSKSIQQSPG